MRNKLIAAFVIAAFTASAALAQTPAPAPAAKSVTVKAVQPGLFEVAGPRVNEAVSVGIQKITATPGKGWRSVYVEVVPWGAIYFGWPKDTPAVPFTITTGRSGETATIDAPGFTKAKQDDYASAINRIVTRAIAQAQDAKKRAMEADEGGRR